jgi:hypothetical protein
MAFTFKIRDFFRPRRDIVKEVGIKEGFHVLDYGCGPGSYVTAVAELVGNSCIAFRSISCSVVKLKSMETLPFTLFEGFCNFKLVLACFWGNQLWET